MILKNLRKEKGLTQAQLGAKIGVTEKTINNYETKGKRPRNIDVYYKLSEVFNVGMSDLVGEEEAFYYNTQKQYKPENLQKIYLVCLQVVNFLKKMPM